MSKTTKALYVPLSIATSVSGGLLAGAVSNSSGAISMTAPRTPPIPRTSTGRRRRPCRRRPCKD